MNIVTHNICSAVAFINIVVRSCLFNILFILLTVFITMVAIPFIYLLKNKQVASFTMLVWSHIILFLLKIICNIGYELRGTKPDTACVIASKHQSALDIPLIVKIFNGKVVFIAKHSLSLIPIVGLFIAKSETVMINRKNGLKSIQKIVNEIDIINKKDKHAVIFPEGKRTLIGQNIKYKPGIALVANNLKANVIPVALNSGCFWGCRSFLKYPGNVIVHLLPPINKTANKREFISMLQDTIDTESQKLLQ